MRLYLLIYRTSFYENKKIVIKFKNVEVNLIQSMSVPYTCTHNSWIEAINGQFKDFIKKDSPEILDGLQIVLNKFVHYNNAKI